MDNTTIVLTNGKASCPYAISVFFTSTMALISLAAFIGNILVIAVVCKTPSLRTSTNYYYVNMAVSDFLASVATWPYYLTNEIITGRGTLIQGPLATVGCKVGAYARLVSSSVSILSLVLIAMDRYIAIVFPLKAKSLTGKLRASLLFTTWLISVSYCFPALYYCKVEDVGHETYCRFAWNATAIMIYYITGMTMINIAPLIAIVILYSRILHALQRRPEYGKGSSYSEQKRRKQNQTIMKIFKSIVVAYFVCFFLLCVYLILKITFSEVFVRDKCRWILGFAYFVLPSLSTAVNPIILFSFSSKFRHALQALFSSLSLGKCRSCCIGKKEKLGANQESDRECLPELVKHRQITSC